MPPFITRPHEPGRMHRAIGLKRGEIERASIIDAKVPIAGRIARPLPTRAAQDDSARSRQGNQQVDQFLDRARQIWHRHTIAPLSQSMEKPDVNWWEALSQSNSGHQSAFR